MKALLYKDLCVLKKSLWHLVLFYIIYAVFMLKIGQYSIMIGMALVLGVSISNSAMAYDEQVQWGRFGQALPFTKKQMVTEKYLLGLVCLLACVCLAFATIVGLERMGALKETASLTEYAVVSFSAFFVGSLMLSITLPMSFWLGVERGRMVFIGVLILLFMGVMGIVSLRGIEEVSIWMEQNALWTVLIVLFVILSSITGSCLVAIKIYKKKEF